MIHGGTGGIFVHAFFRKIVSSKGVLDAVPRALEYIGVFIP